MATLPGEHEAIGRAVQAGERFGYGHLIAILQREWAEDLIRNGLAEDAAMSVVKSRTPYPLRPDRMKP